MPQFHAWQGVNLYFPDQTDFPEYRTLGTPCTIIRYPERQRVQAILEGVRGVVAVQGQDSRSALVHTHLSNVLLELPDNPTKAHQWLRLLQVELNRNGRSTPTSLSLAAWIKGTGERLDVANLAAEAALSSPYATHSITMAVTCAQAILSVLRGDAANSRED